MTNETKKPHSEAWDSTIGGLINLPYETGHDRPCWAFARDCLAVRGVDLPESPRAGLIRVANPVIGAVVMFAAGFDWHCGVIWPDCLHFIHTMPPYESRPHYVEIRQEQLQAEPWHTIIEGYYVPKNPSKEK
jgi:hypothetical protein